MPDNYETDLFDHLKPWEQAMLRLEVGAPDETSALWEWLCGYPEWPSQKRKAPPPHFKIPPHRTAAA